MAEQPRRVLWQMQCLVRVNVEQPVLCSNLPPHQETNQKQHSRMLIFLPTPPPPPLNPKP